jgi:MFS family permease
VVDTQLADEDKNEIKKEKVNFFKKLARDLCKIFANKNFLILNFSYFILSFAILCPHNFLPSHIKLKKIDDPQSLSISFIGFFTLIGQICIGYFSDKFRRFNWLIFSVCIILAGMITCLLPLTNNFYYICVYSSLYGFLTSVNYVLQSSLVIECLDLANLTIAFGCLQMCQGFSTLFGTPFLGWVKDQSEGYEFTFYIGGMLMILSGAVLLLWPCLSKKNVLIVNKDLEQQAVNQKLNLPTD